MNEKTKIVYKVKKSTGKTVTIVILVLLLLLSLGYIGYFEYMKKQDEKPLKKDGARKEMYYSEVSQMLFQIELYNEVFKSEYPISDVNKIENQLKLQFGILALKRDENIHNYYKIEDLKEMYHNYFVSGFHAIYEDIECRALDDALYKLDNERKTYTFVDTHEHGGGPSMDTDTYFVSSKIEGNHYMINTHILYSNYCNDTCGPFSGYYSSYQDCIYSKNQVMNTKNQYHEIKDDLPITTFTFVKDKNYFRLESVEISS